MPTNTLEKTVVNFGVDVAPMEAIDLYLRAGIKISGPERDLLSFCLGARSKLEEKWSAIGKALIESQFGREVVFAGYEWFSFKLPGGSYTPDFNYLLADGRWIHIEVKASERQAGYKDSRAKLRGAASLNPWFVFIQAMYAKGNWNLETIQPDTGYISTLLDAMKR